MSSRNLSLGAVVGVLGTCLALAVANPVASQDAPKVATPNEIGRYQLVPQRVALGGATHDSRDGGVYLIDTATGEVWRAGATESFQPVPVPRQQ